MIPSSPSSWISLLAGLPDWLSHHMEWLVSGSCALALHGVEVSPLDIDLWFTPAELDLWARTQGLEVRLRVHAGYRTEGFTLRRDGWDIDCVGRVILDAGSILQVDLRMLRAASGDPLIESRADLIAELLAMNRPAPKADWKRAWTLAQGTERLDVKAIRSRLRAFGIPPSRVNDMLTFLVN